jgi:hypothetical protein
VGVIDFDDLDGFDEAPCQPHITTGAPS